MSPRHNRIGSPLSGHAGKELAEKILDSLKCGLILIDREGKVQLWNDWIARHSGIPAEFAVGHSLESLFPDGLTAPFRTAIRNALLHKLPIVLSNALHRSPLPIFPLPVTQQEQNRMQQSIALTPIITAEAKHFCLIQITDATLSVKREHALRSRSERLGRQASTDALTGAYNRRFFDERFAAEFGRAQRQTAPLSLIMLDIDYFKNYNDRYGHPAGDKVLKMVVAALKSQLNRPTDVVARYGGEEFAVILPDSGAEGSLLIAEKLRAAVFDLNIPHDKSEVADRLTISLGIAAYQHDAACNMVCFLETADTALYSAKNGGRNCVRQLVTPDCGKDCPDGAPPSGPQD